MNSYVVAIQTELKDANYYSGEVDGIAGPATLNAVKLALVNHTAAPTSQGTLMDAGKSKSKSKYSLTPSSRARLEGVRSPLVQVVNRAIELTTQDFVVIEGLRTLERQKKLVASGASKTLNSNHIKGLAVDLAAVVNGVVNWNEQYYYAIADAMRAAAKELGVRVRWGGAWVVLNDTTNAPKKLVADYAAAKKAAGARPFFDLVHFEIHN